VQAVQPELMMTGLADTPTAMGDSAVVRCQGVDILLCSLRNQAMGSDVFTNIGVDLGAKKLIVVKSSQHFYASFSKLAKKVIYVAAPGAVTVDLKTLPYRKIRRPKWPID
jgi:microcystin degradation protein MlrC